MNEIAANNFAAQLIMPEKLVKESLRDSINELGYSLDQDLVKEKLPKLLVFQLPQLNVSAQALSYRVDNLGLFIDE